MNNLAVKHCTINPIIGLIPLFIFIPDDKYRMIFVVLLFLMVLIITQGKFQINISHLLKLGSSQWYYVFTVIGSQIIHYYGGSAVEIISFLMAFILLRFLVIETTKNTNDFFKLIDYIIFLFSVYAIFNIVESVTQFNLWDTLFNREIVQGGANSYRNGFYRAHGICEVSINNGLIMYMAWILCTYRLIYRKSLLRIIEFAVIGISIFLIFSRAVIAVALVSILLLFLKIRRTEKLRIISVLFFIVIFLLVFGVDEKISKFINSLLKQFLPIIYEFLHLNESSLINSGGSGTRLALWKWVIQSLHNDIFFGKGFTTNFAYHYNNIDGYSVTKNSIEVYWMYLLYQKGIFGLSGFIIYQINCMIKLFRKKNEDRSGFRYCFIIMTIGYFLMLFTVSAFFDLILFYFMFALYEAYCINGISAD